MDIIAATKKDKAYMKYKLIVKNWEKDFKTKHARIPSKFDIKEAPSSIKYAYKKYFQLKSAALENSLSICDFEDEPSDSSDPVPHLEGAVSEVLSPLSETNSQHDFLVPTLPSGQELEQLLSNASNVSIESLKPLSATIQTNVIKPQSPFTANLSKKLFESKKFSIRNPRKSLSKSQSINEDRSFSLENDAKTEEYCSPPSSLLDKINFDNTETLFPIKKHVEATCSNVNISSHVDNLIGIVKTPKVRQLSKAWLDRATGVSSQVLQSSTKLEEVMKPSERTPSFGLANINVPEKTNDFVENSESETEDSAFDKLKPALKKRKTMPNVSSLTPNRHLNEYNDDLEKSSETEIKKQKQVKTKSMNKKSRISKMVDKSVSEHHPPDISEYMPFEAEKDIIPRHSKATVILNKVEKTKQNSSSSSTKEELGKLEMKIKNGSLNENFVKINIEKKVFVRGKKHMNYSKYKKQQWKDSKALHAGMEFPESGKINCLKCGGLGHMARYCKAHKGDILLPLESYDDNDIPTLQDMQNIVSKEKDDLSLTEELTKSIFEPSQIPESFIKLLSDTPCSTSKDLVKPLYTDYQQVNPSELYEALKKFGHTSFRPGQEEAIIRILCGMSTLLILSTGGGKSLCYQIPAYIYSQHFRCITLVISPLVSLMEDQVLNMPEFLKAGCLHTNQPPTQRKKIMQCIKDGEINILLISPEALISGDSSQGFTGLFRSLPQIAFACIDEAHCVSQWSHNFRPSYLMLCRVLREKLNVKCILGLTATASQTTTKSVISHFNIPDGLTGVITNPTLPHNLLLSVSLERDKDRALVTLLNSERISAYNSIIVYCIRRDECERIAAVLRSCLQVVGQTNMDKQNNKRKRMSYIAEAYHAGMSAAQRKKIQKHFMDGTLRIIVATVAFGMGINKSNIRCIIHYNMPSSFESYVQEVGRAGRDGESAYCHVLMNNSNTDKNELLKHIYANTIDRPTIRKLLQRVFIPCECGKSQETLVAGNNSPKERCKGHEVAIPIDATVEELDLPSENIATLLCYVELHPKKYIKVLNNAYTMCKIFSYGGPRQILEAAKKCAPLAMAYLLESKKAPDVVSKNILEFNVIEVAAAIGWESGMTKFHLKNLEWISENGTSKRSQLKIEFNTLGFRLKASGDLNAAELDSILDDIHGVVLTQEKAMLYQLEETHQALSKLGNHCIENTNLPEETLIEKSNELKDTIRNYFQRESSIANDIHLQERPLDTERVVSDVRALIVSYKDCSFNGRSIARIFQGISSPNFPAIVWGRCKFWRSHIHEDFYGIMKVATQQIIQMKL